MKLIARRRTTREEILVQSVPLFARCGYDGVTMRDIATAMGLTPAALYYHFPDKENLYLEVIAYAVRERSATLKVILEGSGTPWERLEGFITSHALLTAEDKNFQRLMQWVLLDCNEERQHQLAEHVFRDLFNDVYKLADELDSRHDSHMLAISILGLVFFHFQAGPSRHFMPGYLPQQDDPSVLSWHVISLLRDGLTGHIGLQTR